MSKIQYPENWKLHTVDESCSLITSGGTPNRTNSDFFGGDIPWVKMTDLKVDLILDTKEKLSNEGIANSSAKIFPKNTVLIAMYTHDLGKTAMLGIDAATNQAICGLQPKDNLLPKFLFYFLKSKINILKKLSRGAAQPNINQNKIKTLEIPIPSLEIQTKIIEKLDNILSDINDKKKIFINSHKNFTNKNFILFAHDVILKNAFSGKLTKFEKDDDLFPKFDELKLNSTLKTHILPKHWRWIPISSVCDGIVPGRYKPTNFSGDIPWITTPDLSELYIEKSKKMLGLTKDEVKKVNMKIIPKGTVLMTCVGHVGMVSITKNDVVPNQQLHGFVPHDTTISLYIAYALLSQKKQIESLATKTTLPYLNKTKCNGIMIPICSIQEQERVVSAITDLFAKTTNFEKSRNQIIKLQKSILNNIDLLKDRVLIDGFSGRLVN